MNVVGRVKEHSTCNCSYRPQSRPASGATSSLEVSAAAWSPVYRHEKGLVERVSWLRAQTWPLSALDQTHRASLRAVDEAVAWLRSVDEDLRTLLTLEPLRARAERLRCFRGIDDLTALTIAAELGDPRRFAAAPRVMAFVGLVPSEHSSHGRAARSPKPGMPTCGASSSKPRGTIVIGPLSAPRCDYASRARLSRSSRTPGRRRRACIGATIASADGENRTNR
ncbi:MAG: transposase [Vicinamibacterales bacterium]